MRFFLGILSLAVFLATVICLAQDEEVLTLKEAVSIAEARSPEVKSIESQLDSASAKERLALALSEPSLAIGWGDLTEPFNLSSAASNTFQLSQTVGFPGRAFINRSVLANQNDSLRQQLRSIRLQVSTNVKQAYYNLALAQKNISLNEDQKLSYQRILAIAKRQYETGVSSQVDLLNAQLALLQNTNDLSDLGAAENLARAQLNVLIGKPESSSSKVTPLTMEERPPVSLDDSLTKMIANRPEIKAAEAQEKAAESAYQLAWMQLLPDFQLVAGTTFYRVPSASPLSNLPDAATSGYPTHTYMAGVQLTLPLWFLFNEREVISGASKDRVVASANLDIQHEQSRVSLVTVVEAINGFRLKIKNYEEHMLPMAEQALNIALTSYGAGKIPFQTLSDTASARRQIRLAYAQAIVSYETNYATYGQLIGEDL